MRFFFSWQMVVPLFAAPKCTWPQFSNKSLWVLAKNLFCTFTTFPNDKFTWFQAKYAFPHTSPAYMGFFGEKRPLSGILEYELGLNMLKTLDIWLFWASFSDLIEKKLWNYLPPTASELGQAPLTRSQRSKTKKTGGGGRANTPNVSNLRFMIFEQHFF